MTPVHLMEISKVQNRSLRVKARNVTFIINPEKKIEGDVVVLTSKPKDYSLFEDKLVIDGPGEYEVSGVSIHGEDNNGNLSFDFLEDSQRLLVLSSPSIAKTHETEDYAATVVFLDDTGAGSLSQVASEVVAVVGNEESLPKDSQVKKADKINLKKLEEHKGFIVHLSK